MLLGVTVLLFIAYVTYVYMPRQSTVAPVSTSSTSQTSGKVVPPSAAVMQQLAESHGFQAFVSITDSGFEPATTTIKVGQTIRFTNNSSQSVQIGQLASENMPASPGAQSCGVSFNPCRTLQRGDFAEFTFSTKGAFLYMDTLNTATQGAVIVK